MSIEKFFVRTVTITRPAQVPGYGDGTVEDYDTGTTRTTRGWLHQLSESELGTETRDAELATYVLRLPMGTDIAARDRVTVDGTRFEVDGPPAHAWRPQGEHHIRASLKYVDG